MHVQITDYAGVRIKCTYVHAITIKKLGLWSAGHYTQVSTISRMGSTALLWYKLPWISWSPIVLESKHSPHLMLNVSKHSPGTEVPRWPHENAGGQHLYNTPSGMMPMHI